MKNILIGALVCAAVAGIFIYLNDPEEFDDAVSDLKDKSEDAIGKVKKGWSKSKRELKESLD